MKHRCYGYGLVLWDGGSCPVGHHLGPKQNSWLSATRWACDVVFAAANPATPSAPQPWLCCVVGCRLSLRCAAWRGSRLRHRLRDRQVQSALVFRWVSTRLGAMPKPRRSDSCGASLSMVFVCRVRRRQAIATRGKGEETLDFRQTTCWLRPLHGSVETVQGTTPNRLTHSTLCTHESGGARKGDSRI